MYWSVRMRNPTRDERHHAAVSLSSTKMSSSGAPQHSGGAPESKPAQAAPTPAAPAHSPRSGAGQGALGGHNAQPI